MPHNWAVSTAADDPVEQAVDRALKPLRDDAVRDVEAILDAALKVAELSAPAAPRVADIVAEAGTSNQAFYRYFNGKDDLMQAVMARGLRRVHAYLDHRMSKVDDPAKKIDLWIRGILTQATHQVAARQGAAVTEIFAVNSGGIDSQSQEATIALQDLLIEPLMKLGSSDPIRDAALIRETSMGTMRTHMNAHTSPTQEDSDRLVDFCLRGINTTQ